MNGDVCAQFPLQEMVDFAAESVRSVSRSLESERYIYMYLLIMYDLNIKCFCGLSGYYDIQNRLGD